MRLILSAIGCTSSSSSYLLPVGRLTLLPSNLTSTPDLPPPTFLPLQLRGLRLEKWQRRGSPQLHGGGENALPSIASLAQRSRTGK